VLESVQSQYGQLESELRPETPFLPEAAQQVLANLQATMKATCEEHVAAAAGENAAKKKEVSVTADAEAGVRDVTANHEAVVRDVTARAAAAKLAVRLEVTGYSQRRAARNTPPFWSLRLGAPDAATPASRPLPSGPCGSSQSISWA
jgi:hypothetical protein